MSGSHSVTDGFNGVGPEKQTYARFEKVWCGPNNQEIHKRIK